MDAQDLDTLDVLLPPNPKDRKTLADLIFSKIDEADTAETNATPRPRGACVRPRHSLMLT